jgi:hypothetical protein
MHNKETGERLRRCRRDDRKNNRTINQEREKLAHMVSMTSLDRRTPWIDMRAAAPLAFRANNADIMGVSVQTHHIKAADTAKIGDVAKIVADREGELSAIER